MVHYDPYGKYDEEAAPFETIQRVLLPKIQEWTSQSDWSAIDSETFHRSLDLIGVQTLSEQTWKEKTKEGKTKPIQGGSCYCWTQIISELVLLNPTFRLEQLFHSFYHRMRTHHQSCWHMYELEYKIKRLDQMNHSL